MRLVKKFFAQTILLLLLLGMLLLEASTARFKFLDPDRYIVGKSLAVVGGGERKLCTACWVDLYFSVDCLRRT